MTIKSYPYNSATYFAFLNYVDSLWTSGDQEGSIGIYIAIEKAFSFIYTPIAGLGLIHCNLWDTKINTSDATSWWPKITKFVNENKQQLVTSSDPTIRKLIDVSQRDDRIDPRLRAVFDFMRELFLTFVEEADAVIPIDYLLEEVPELELHVQFRPSQELSLHFYQGYYNAKKGQVKLQWEQVITLLDQPKMRLTLLTSPHEFSRRIGKAY